MMSMMEAVRSAFIHYADFSGRARRSEYWYFGLFNSLVSLALGIVTGIVTAFFGERSGPVAFLTLCDGVYSLAIFIPQMALTWRRLHDIGKSGLFCLLPLGLTVGFTILMVIALIGMAAARSSAIYTAFGGITLLFGLAMIALAIVMLIWMCRDSQYGPNKYGPDPKAREHGIPDDDAGDERPPWVY